MNRLSFLILSISLLSIVPIILGQTCSPNPCDPARESACYIDPGLGRSRCNCTSPFDVRFRGTCLRSGEVGVGCDNDTDCVKLNEVCDLRLTNPPIGSVGAIMKKGICRCPPGSYRDIYDGRCNVISLNPPFRSAICSAFGDPHFDTFDSRGTHYGYQGSCDYLLVGHDDLQVQVRNGICGPGVSCVKAIAFLAGSDTIIFDETGVYFGNGTQVSPLPTTINGVNITDGVSDNCPKNNYGFAAAFPDGALVEYGFACSAVSLPESYFSAGSNWTRQTRGLCGTWNDNVDDDGRIPPSGDIVGNIYDYSNSSAANTFGDAWRIPFGPLNLFPTRNFDCSFDSIRRQGTATGGVLCQGNATKAALVVDACRTLSSSCDAALSVEDFYFACVFDTCTVLSQDPLTSYKDVAQAVMNGFCNFITNGVPQKFGTNTPRPTIVPTTPSTATKEISSLGTLLILALLFSVFC